MIGDLKSPGGRRATASFPGGSSANKRRPFFCLLVLMLIEFLRFGFVASVSLCVRFGRNFVKLCMLHVSLLKYVAM